MPVQPKHFPLDIKELASGQMQVSVLVSKIKVGKQLQVTPVVEFIVPGLFLFLRLEQTKHLPSIITEEEGHRH